MPKIRFTQNIQRHIACPPGNVNGTTVQQVLDHYFVENPQARGYVLDDQGLLRTHMAIFINGRQLPGRQSLDHAVPADGVVDVMQALSGG